MFEYENDLLIVDELITDPSLKTAIVVKIRDNYYMINNTDTYKPIPERALRPYNRQVDKNWYKASSDYEFYLAGLIPRDGFKVSLGRSITQEELQEIIDRYGLTEKDISDEFEDKVGMIYGDKYAKTYKAIQIRVPFDDAKAIEHELLLKNIQAYNIAPGRINIRTGWGGAREGAGRKPTGRRLARIYCTEEEEEKLRAYLKELRGE